MLGCNALSPKTSVGLQNLNSSAIQHFSCHSLQNWHRSSRHQPPAKQRAPKQKKGRQKKLHPIKVSKQLCPSSTLCCPDPIPCLLELSFPTKSCGALHQVLDLLEPWHLEWLAKAKGSSLAATTRRTLVFWRCLVTSNSVLWLWGEWMRRGS